VRVCVRAWVFSPASCRRCVCMCVCVCVCVCVYVYVCVCLGVYFSVQSSRVFCVHHNPHVTYHRTYLIPAHRSSENYHSSL